MYFAIHYFEGLPPVAGFSVAQLWKIPVLLFLLFYCFYSKRKLKPFEKTNFFLVIEMLFNKDLIVSPKSLIIGSSKQMPLGLFYNFFVYGFRNNASKLETILYSFAQFICLSSLPCLLGIIHPLYNYINADSFGIEGLYYYSGLFNAPHCAASYFAIAVIVLVYGFKQKRFVTFASKLFNLALVCVGIVSIFKAYVRTGWLMLIVGIAFIFVFSIKKTRKKITYLVSFLILFGGGVLFLYNQNDAFRSRLQGNNIYTNTGGESIEIGGSGRLSFWQNGIHLWTNSDNVGQLLFGQGYYAVIQQNEMRTGLRVFSHNMFVDVLSQHGLFGLLLVIIYFGQIYVYIRKNRNNSYYILAKAVFWMSIVFSFFQNEVYFDYAFVFAIILAMLPNSPAEKKI